MSADRGFSEKVIIPRTKVKPGMDSNPEPPAPDLIKIKIDSRCFLW